MRRGPPLAWRKAGLIKLLHHGRAVGAGCRPDPRIIRREAEAARAEIGEMDGAVTEEYGATLRIEHDIVRQWHIIW